MALLDNLALWTPTNGMHDIISGTVATIDTFLSEPDRFAITDGATATNAAESMEYAIIPFTATGSTSIGMWVKFTTAYSTEQCLFSGTSDKYSLATIFSTSLGIGISRCSADSYNYQKPTGLTDGWVFIAWTLGSSIKRFYFNGELISSTSTYKPISINSSYYIGHRNYGFWFYGNIGETFLFNRDVSGDEWKLIYDITQNRYLARDERKYKSLFDGCVAFWPLRYDAVDTVGGHNGTVSGGVGPSTGRFEEENGAFYFDGADDRISVNLYPDFPTSELTISFWLYPYELPLDELYDEAYIFAQYNGTFNLNRIEYYTNGYIRISNYYNNTWHSIASTNTCPILEWTFITITFDGTITKIYLNGILDSEHTFAYWENSNNPHFFGERDSSTWRYNGKISEFAIFSECKSQSIVSTLYNISKMKHIAPTIDDNRR